ncbi:MAG: hypothetical protein AB7O96_14580 [Pseudobdellovibrionaceae bacterium]
MKEFTLISLACLSSLFLGCASQNTKSLLEERAGYNFAPPPIGMKGSGGVEYVPTRVPEQVIVAWLHAKELPSKDYFWGSWLSIVVAPETWEMKKVSVPKNEKKQMKRTPERPTLAPPKIKRS